MLFNFALAPLEEIQALCDPPDLSLYWFGLSDGTYYLQAGQHQLLRYSDEALRFFADQNVGAVDQPFVDYYVARLIEDIFELAPHALDPIPDDLIPYASNELALAWQDECQRWMEQQPNNDAWDVYHDAVGWLGSRSLDTGYLSPIAKIWIWRHGELVTIEWDNRDCKFNGIPWWAEQQGRYSLPVDQFRDELESFRLRFLAAMRERVEEVGRSKPRPEVQIDREQLLTDQSYWERPADQLVHKEPPTDWAVVHRAIQHISRRQHVAGGSKPPAHG